MKCDRCNEDIPAGEARDYQGRKVCEDCMMIVLSPARACDPWAVFCAKSIPQGSASAPAVTNTQSEILRFLEETGGAAVEVISERLQLEVHDLEKEIATLRHMEKVRAQLRDGKKVICLW